MSNELILGTAVLALVVVLITFTLLRRRPKDVDFEELAQELAGEAEPKEREKPEEVPAPEEDRASRLARGLAKTRSALASTIRSLGGREKLDDQAWEQIEDALIAADVGMGPTKRVLEALRADRPDPQDLSAALRKELIGVLDKGDRTLKINEGEPTVWLVIGVNGVGKTTSIAKLANRLIGEQRGVVLAAGDTFRAAAIDQLGLWAERLGVHMVKHQPGSDSSAVVFDAIEHARAKRVDVVIVDTAGRLHTKSNLMEELKKVRRVVEREAGEVGEALLVLDATVGQNGLAQAKAFHEAIGATGVILTKLDGSAKGGIVLAVQEQLGIPVKMVGVGEGIDDLETFSPQDFIDALLEGSSSP
ncbi:MAG: signal recognition particle-docking protein FtsY [Actinomycetota bacterium]